MVANLNSLVYRLIMKGAMCAYLVSKFSTPLPLYGQMFLSKVDENFVFFHFFLIEFANKSLLFG